MKDEIKELLSRFEYSLENFNKEECKKVTEEILSYLDRCSREDLLLIIACFEKHREHPYLTGAIDFKV